MIIDITKELFSTPVYPGDPVPSAVQVLGFKKEKPDVCQLTRLSLGSHSGTHLDAPRHFIPGGADVAHIRLEKCFGLCKVAACRGPLQPSQIKSMLEDGTTRLLLKGDVEITPEAALVFTQSSLTTLGVEANTVGNQVTGPVVHRTLLAAEIVILENLDLTDAEPGNYLLSALPLKMDDLDGSPIRAILSR